MDITIPKTLAAAKTRLNGIGVEAGWVRAAIVYAFTLPAVNQNAVPSSAQRLSLNAFAKQGIVGLRNPHTVAAYRKAWDEAIKDGSVSAEPGKTVTIPSRDFPDNPDSPAGTKRSFTAAVKKNPAIIKEIVENDPETFEAVAEAVSHHPSLPQRAIEKAEERRRTVPAKPAGPKYWDEMTKEVTREFSKAVQRMTALIENRDQLDEYEMKRVLEVLEPAVPDLTIALADVRDTYVASFGPLPGNLVKELA